MNKKIIATMALFFVLSALFLPVTTVSADGTGWIAGTVNEGYITPIPGVTVTVVGKSVTTTSDASGKFNLSIAPGTYDVKFSKLNYVDYTKTGVTVTANKTTTISASMSKAKGGIHGKVTDKSTTKGIYMATVTYGTGFLDEVFTTNDGSYKIDGLEVGNYYLNVTTLGDYKPSATTKVTVTANTNATQNFQLEAIPVYLLVRVYDGGLLGFADTTKPLVGATVTLDTTTLTTDSKGFANFTNLQKRKYNVTITKSGFDKFTAASTTANAPDMALGSQTYTVGLISKKATNSVFGAALLCLLIPIIIIVIVVVVIIVVIIMLRKKKAKAQVAPAPGMAPQQPYGAPPPGAAPPQQPPTYEQMYGTPPPQQPGYSQPPAPPGQYQQPPGQYQQPPGQYQQPPPQY
jgi:hypothetical protein